jgi:probable phosphoglycerate mutase
MPHHKWCGIVSASSIAHGDMTHPTPSLTLLLIRHGETALNAEARFRGRADVDLNEHGRQQAEALARSLPRRFAIGHLYSSPLKRCLETARPLTTTLGLAVTPEPRLIDLDYGEWQGRLIAEVAERSPQDYAAWLSGDLLFRFPGGEPLSAPAERLRSFIDYVIERHQGETVAAVTHNVLCQMATCLLLDKPVRYFQSVRHNPGAVSVFRWRAGTFREDGLNLAPREGQDDAEKAAR